MQKPNKNMDNEVIVIERLFKAPVKIIWKAITDKVEMKKWYFDLQEFIPEPGFKFQFMGGPTPERQYLHVCEITEVIPFKKLTYSWSYDGYAGISYVTFELFEQKNKTILKLSHTGIDSFPKENSDFALNNFALGWDQIINSSLNEYLDLQVK